jgi:gamma-glutamyltranspeptidase/glutathione hydrolase
MPPRGIYSVTVPGVVAGWDALRGKLGTLPFSEILAPAIYYAENGFPLSEVIARGWARSKDMLASHPNSKETYLIDGQPPRAGEVFRNPDLARSLRRIAEKGRDGYYKGPTAEAILGISAETGGTFTGGYCTADCSTDASPRSRAAVVRGAKIQRRWVSVLLRN